MSNIKDKILLPEIIWDVSPLLESLLKPYAEANQIPIIPIDKVKRRLPLYEREWKKNGGQVLRILCERLQISFLEKTISVWLSGSMVGGRSIPLIVSSNKDPEDVFDLVTHELIHRLAYRNLEGWDYRLALKRIVSSDDMLFFNHVFVFSVHRYLFEKMPKSKKRIERESRRSESHPSYEKAWKFVEEYGYENLLRDIGL